MATPTDWKAKAKQWRNGINIQTATNKDLTDFTLFKLQEYNKYKLINNGLWSFFQDNFEAFNVNIFLKVFAQHFQSMHTFLQQKGVYVYTKEKCTTYA